MTNKEIDTTIDEAVILLGGMGSRMLPYTKTVSKEMLPIYDVPNIFLIVKEAYLSGIKKIIFVVTEHNVDLIKKFFSNDSYLNEFLKDKPEKLAKLNAINEIINNMEFTYVYQEMLGTYGALYSAKDYLKHDNFIVMYGDDLIDSPTPLTSQLIESFKKNNMQQVAVNENMQNIPNVGIAVASDKNTLINLVPKNETSSRRVVHGRMLLNKKIFSIKDTIKKHNDNEYYLPYELLNFSDVYLYSYKGNYFNIGEKTGFIKASIYYALKDNKEKDNLVHFINNIKEDYG
ncbi:MAG: hypothetical protein IJ068_02220 [Bacilli bacterium]|nr:hypothetical protein [Bacilli bacterium]